MSFPARTGPSVAALAAGLLLLNGCVSSSAPAAIDSPSKETREIAKRVEEVLEAAARADLPRLDSYHAYGPKFTKFGSEAPGRQDAAQAREGEHEGLTAVTGLTMKADDLRADVFGKVAVATFILNYGFLAGTNVVAKQARTTLVLVKRDGHWLITHEHLSPVPVVPAGVSK